MVVLPSTLLLVMATRIQVVSKLVNLGAVKSVVVGMLAHLCTKLYSKGSYGDC